MPILRSPAWLLAALLAAPALQADPVVTAATALSASAVAPPATMAATNPAAALQAIAQRQATPEAGSGRYPLSVAHGSRAMVVTAHPLATEAALEMLRAGGSAADAAVAAEAVLGLVEPQSSGLGGGGFLVHAHQGEVTAIDGRETAPASAKAERFLDAQGRPLPFDAALAGARAVGIPGTVALLAEAHQRWGRLPWSRLLQPAIRLAEHGAPVSHRLSLLSAQDRLLAANPGTRAFYFDANGKAWPQNHLLRNPEQARLLRILAAKGPQAFYQDTLAAELVDGLRTAGSDITLADWQSYRARVTPALCRPLQAWRVCSAPAPAGGLTVLENLGLWLTAEGTVQAAAQATPPAMERVPAAQTDLAPASLHRLLEAERLAFADRQRYGADPAITPVPVDGLLDPAYWQTRAALIGERAAGVVAAGVPAGAPLAATDRQLREVGTSHLAIVDGRGHWLAMTSSIEDAFGSRLMVNGLMMNNQLTDFSFVPALDGLPVANRVEPGKRPRSAMSPTLVLDGKGQGQGQPLLAVGSPGGSRILGFNTRMLAAWLGGQRDAGALVSLPHALNRNGITEVESGLDAATLADLKARGHDVREVEMTSGLGVIVRQGVRLQGAADPRREGRAAGF